MSAEGKMQVEMQCPDCGGDGLCMGMCEPNGVAAICSGCNGSGKKVLEYTPFTGRKSRTDVRIVWWRKGIPATPRSESEGIPYSDWLAGKLPPR